MKGKKNKQNQELPANAERQARRRLPPTLSRTKAFRDQIPTILIVCEGQNTEPSYFNHFRLSTINVKSIGEGFNTLSLVKRASKFAKETDYEQVWCVFDRDNHPNFTSAIALARKLKFSVAYSNQAFEYWILLHFSDHQGGKMSRTEYNKNINKLLKPHQVQYDGYGTKYISKALFDLMQGFDKKTGKQRIKLAIERARRNEGIHEGIDPAIAESSTTVYRLVEELLRYV